MHVYEAAQVVVQPFVISHVAVTTWNVSIYRCSVLLLESAFCEPSHMHVSLHILFWHFRHVLGSE